MKTRELRIGSIVYAFNEFKNGERIVDTIATITQYGWETVNGRNGIEPIQLTEEWLLKFGFELYENAGIYGVYREIFPPVSGFEITADSEGYWYWPAGMFNAIKIKSVHQLQNLYFALTGEELTIKTSEDETKKS